MEQKKIQGVFVKINVIGFTLLLLTGCQTTQIVPYQPEGKEIFVFNEDIDPSYHLVGYGSLGEFCPEITQWECKTPLPYTAYKNTKGYFEQDTPYYIKGDGFFNYYPVVLEDGKKLFYRTLRKRGRYDSHDHILSLTLYNELKALEGEKLAKNSDLYITKAGKKKQQAYLKLSNNEEVTLEQFKLIRQLSEKFPSKKIADYIVGLSVTYDNVDEYYTISTYEYSKSDYIKVSLDISEYFAPRLKNKVYHYGSSWLFAESYKVSIGSYKWSSKEQDFYRDHSHGNIWEWRTDYVDNRTLEMLTELSQSDKATIRLYGKQYYHDFNVKGIKQISNLLTLYSVLTNENM